MRKEAVIEPRLTPRPYQEEDIEVVKDGIEMGALIAHEMGVGKTLIAVEALLRRGVKRILIIAPLNTHQSWERTINAQSQGKVRVYVHPPGSSTTPEANQWWRAVAERWEGWYVIGWEAFRGRPTKQQTEKYQRKCEEAKRQGRKKMPARGINLDWRVTGEWDAVVADECHRMASRKSMAFLTATSVISDFRIAMSGTPARNKVEGYWSSLHWLWPHRFDNFYRWLNSACSTVSTGFGGGKIAVGEKYPGAITNKIPCYLRRTTEEVIKDLPDVIERTVSVPLLSGAQTKAYRDLEKRAFTWLDGMPLGTRLSTMQNLRLRQVALGVPRVTETDELDEDGFPKLKVDFALDCKSNKIDMLKEIISDLDEEEPVLVYTHSAKFAHSVVHQLNKAKLGPAAAIVDGTTAKQKNKALSSFGKPGGTRVIVAGIAKMGEGTDGLQHVCHHEVWLSRHDDNVYNIQAEKRLHRPGQKHPVQRWILISENTADDQVYERTEENAEQMRQVYAKR